MRLDRFALAAAITCALLPVPCRGQAFVAPLVVERSPTPITIANAGAEPMRVAVQIADFDQDGAGVTTFRDVGQSSHSCGERMRVTTPPTQIAARSEIRLLVTVEAGERPCWGAVLVRLSHGLAAGARIGVKVYSSPAGAPRSAEVARIAFERDSVRAVVVNTGPTPLRPRGRIELRSPAGAVLATFDVAAFGLHPGIRRTVSVPAGSLPAGRYVALAVFDVGNPDLIAGEAVVDVPQRPAGGPQ
ncbi:MAG TPA: hypothetical protein VFS20_16340 [Longimicrobium sp.]|nr:hypothetical protein [Longimicrobium sp.]